MKRIKLENFRCYKEQTIDFKSGINLLIGDNATGKTTILKACKYVLGAFFYGFRDEYARPLNIQNNDFREVMIDGIIAPEEPVKISFYGKTAFEQINNKRSILEFLSDVTQYLYKENKTNRTSRIKGISEYTKHAKHLSKTFFTEEGQQKPLPLFAYFSTYDIHFVRNVNAFRFRSYSHKPSFGYYKCLEGNGFLSYWIKRLIILEEGQKNLQEVEIVRHAIIDALGENGCNIINGMAVRPKQGKVYYSFIDGREVEAEQLSDGYKRIVNIVTDIAFRCAFLNRGLYGENAAKETLGTVLIDEIDLHLHPTLQSTVLKGLRNAFPKLQFIVSSHAPMVMSSVESNEENVVYKLDYNTEDGYSVNEVVTYGMDLSTISEVVLKHPSRDLKADADLSSLFELIDEDKIIEAKLELERLKGIYSNNPELTRAETMLNFVIFDDEEDN